MLLRRNALIQELAGIDEDLVDVNDTLSQIPASIAVHEDDKKSLAHQARRLEKSLKAIPGSADDDQREIEIVDSIRLRAIQNFLGLM